MNDKPFEVAHISSIETVAAGGRVRVAVREHFDIGAFGVKAFFASRAGDELIEEHDELVAGALGHEELYFVASGRATFTINGETVAAPMGTFVFVRDPAATRSAVAAEEGTTALVIGGRRGQPFRVAPWEYSSKAYRHMQKKDYGAAKGAFEEGLAEYPGDASLLYNLACSESLAGEAAAALEHLRQAVERDHRVKEWARRDKDLDPIRDDPAFPL